MMFDDLRMKIILHEETALGYIYIYMYKRKVCEMMFTNISLILNYLANITNENEISTYKMNTDLELLRYLKAVVVSWMRRCFPVSFHF